MRKIVLIAHNLRSCHNVGSLLRTAEGLAVQSVYLTGYTPYPAMKNDSRLPHLRQKIDKQIHKTSLGAEKLVTWHHQSDVKALLKQLRSDGFQICALEQTPQSVEISKFQFERKIALIVGREVEGIEIEVLDLADSTIFIPMLGQKESFNVVQASAMALYHMRFEA